MDCTICLESFECSDITWLPCSHYLCNSCFVKLTQDVCPFCRANINEIDQVHSSSVETHFLSSSHITPIDIFQSFDNLYSISAPPRIINIDDFDSFHPQIQRSRTNRRQNRRTRRRQQQERSHRTTTNETTVSSSNEIVSVNDSEIEEIFNESQNEETNNNINIFFFEEEIFNEDLSNNTNSFNDKTQQKIRNNKNNRWNNMNNQQRRNTFY